MEPQRLAARQKRYRDILHFAQNEVMDPQLKSKLLSTLSKYRGVLGEYWKQPTTEGSELKAIDSIERELEKLHNDCRLRTSSK